MPIILPESVQRTDRPKSLNIVLCQKITSVNTCLSDVLSDLYWQNCFHMLCLHHCWLLKHFVLLLILTVLMLPTWAVILVSYMYRAILSYSCTFGTHESLSSC